MDRMPASTILRGDLSSKWKQRLRRKLLAWYPKHARDLPWRRSHDPYHVWVSEIMLQQTQVATVEAYFVRFLSALPTVHDLAAADEQQVMRLWEGLGYYRRARQLHAAARVIIDELGGQMPRDSASLRKLPGIGRYTAGAICSIAYGQREPILEANTIRLLSRLVGYRNDPTKAAGQRVLWQTAEVILPRKNIAQFNQSLMELGSLVCTPTGPRCDQCPVASLCATHKAGLQHEIPLAKKKQTFTDLHEAAVVVRKNGLVLLRQCVDGERWAGLWDFPRFEIENHQSPQLQKNKLQKELATKVHEQTGIRIEPGEQLKETTRELLRLYRKSVGRGANLLLNIAIDRDGKVPQATVEQLVKLGKTIGKSGDAGSGASKAKTCSAKAGEPCPPKAKAPKVCSGKDPKTCPPKDTKKACSSKERKSCGKSGL